MPDRILIIEDDKTLRLTVRDILEREGHELELAEDGRSGLELFARRNFNLVLLDLRLPDMHGLEALRAIREADESAVVIVMTAYPEVRTAVETLKAGAYDYLNKPFENDDLKEAVRRALETRRLQLEVERLKLRTGENSAVSGLIGESPSFAAMLEVTRRIAAAPRVPVLIRGESGTGKEHVAQAIRSLSPRASGPWVTLNCSALPEGLLESEMFGHEKGAFTDAKSAKRGLLELADGGTLFLDEIGDLSPALQPKLLRAIETQTFRRVGGQKELKVDVRFVAATNRDLEAMVRAGRFREDLYYRLNVGSIDVPPLRARPEDIMLLARHFIERAAPMMGVPMPDLHQSVNAYLANYPWPGNVRELRNVMERALILSGGATIRPLHLAKEIVGPHAAKTADAGTDGNSLLSLAEVEKRQIRRTLESCRGNKTQAAKLLGISRLTLRNKVTEFGWSEFLEKATDAEDLR
ncbi:MAG: sigma-54-dependent Fis family transcriptional regulator [Hyphomicrobiaceae bacterium]|nr:MAG: sigma-54-dependent Fis family transcriptional regulator [Hyphomicrobiaceae bacterium]